MERRANLWMQAFRVSPPIGQQFGAHLMGRHGRSACRDLELAYDELQMPSCFPLCCTLRCKMLDSMRREMEASAEVRVSAD